MDAFEKSLKSRLGEALDCVPKESKVRQTIDASRSAFYDSESARSTNFLEFLFQQSIYIKKRWWFMQAVILGILWKIICYTGSNAEIQRSMGIYVPVFVILVVPELWKNRSYNAMEIEGTSRYHLRQIYAARMLLFAFVDVLLLSAFFVAASMTLQIEIREVLIQFFVPFNVTCCICFGTHCSRHFNSAFFAVAFSILWSSGWVFIVLQEEVYHAISDAIWFGLLFCTILYLCYLCYRLIKDCEREWEREWN